MGALPHAIQAYRILSIDSRSRQISADSWEDYDLPRSPPIIPDFALPPPNLGPASNARPARSGSSYGPTRPHRPLRRACRPAQTAERHERGTALEWPLGRRGLRGPHRPNALRTHDQLVSQALHTHSTAKQHAKQLPLMHKTARRTVTPTYQS